MAGPVRCRPFFLLLLREVGPAVVHHACILPPAFRLLL